MGEINDWVDDAASLLKLLGHPVRLALLEELSKGTKCVNDIRDLVDIRQANVSQHLSVLRKAGLVTYQEQGNLRCYYLAQPALVEKLLSILRHKYSGAQSEAEVAS